MSKKQLDEIEFFTDKNLNEEFNRDYRAACKDYDSNEARILKNLIVDYSKVVPLWNYAMAHAVLNLADMQMQQQKILSKIKGKDGDNNISRTDTDMLNSINNAIKEAKKDLGIDPKSLASKGDGSMNEAFADVVARYTFNQKRTIMKPIFGLKRYDSGTLRTEDEFATMGEEALDKFLDHAETN